MSLPLSFFPPRLATDPAPTYSLLTLTPALLALLEAGDQTLEIRGHSTDAAVLVSEDKTWDIRGVQNSNSLCLCACTGVAEGAAREEGGRDWFKRAPAVGDLDEDDADDEGYKGKRIQIETILHETLEVVPSVARTERLPSLLKGSEYVGDSEDDSSSPTYLPPSALSSLLPASNAEITSALRAHRVVTIEGFLRPLPPSYLITILPAILSVLPAPPGAEGESMDVDSAAKKEKKKKGDKIRKGAVKEEEKIEQLRLKAELDELLSALDAVDCGEEAGRGVIEWFAKEMEEGMWEVSVEEVVREIGVGVLEGGGYGAQRLDTFLARWKELCGSFAYLCVLPLLAATSILTHSLPASITYLPSTHLSSDPSSRFTELFSLRPRWKDTEMVLFLDDLVGGDKKKRDAMVLKFVRKVKENDGTTTWTARNLW